MMSSVPRQKDVKYGELVIIGFNGKLPRENRNRKRNKLILLKRPEANGIILTKNIRKTEETEQSQSQAPSVTYAFPNSTAVIVECDTDKQTDMFQIGRSSESTIDFIILDTSSNQKDIVKAYSSVSRFACRILVDREDPYVAKIFAAGFNSNKNIHLGNKAIKWWKEDGTIDGLTTNGVLIVHPTGEFCGGDSKYGVWHEVSVSGDIYSLRDERKSRLPGKLVDSETNILKDGTLINLCGATLLWRSADGLNTSPDNFDVEELIQNLNECNLTDYVPVKKILAIPRSLDCKTAKAKPYAYVECGHVQFFGDSESIKNKCPVCSLSSSFIKLCMGLESTFYSDYGPPVGAFNPCGHMATKKTVKFWATAEIPHGGNSFIAVCPFCATPLDGYPGYIELLFTAYTNNV